MDLGIAGKVALVTGGTGGIGRAISEQLASEGCRMVIAARGQAGLDATVDAIQGSGGTAVAVSADLTDFDTYPRMIEAANEAYGAAPDIGVFQPVAPPPGAFDDFGDEAFHEAYRLTAIAFAHFVRAVAPAMKQNRWGRIVTVGSGHAKWPGRLSTRGFSYVLANTCRPGALGLSRSVADELGEYGITVNTVPPGMIDTGAQYQNFFRQLADASDISYEELLADQIRHVPVGREGRPEEVAAVCTFLCSTLASYITGQYVIVDGGYMEIFN